MIGTLTGSKTQPRAVTVTDSVKYRFSLGLLLVLAVCFLLQIFSPLRLNRDAITLLSAGESAAHGGGFLEDGEPILFPPGYPALLAVLMRLGLAHPWALVGLNAVFLSAGLFAGYFLLIREFFEDKAVVLFICSFFLLSFVVVKHFPIPLTEVPFFCCSMCCLAVMSQAKKMDWNWRFVALTVSALILAIAAITVRSVGVALVPPFLLMIVCTPRFKSLLKRLSRRTKLAVVVASVFAAVGTMLVIAKTSVGRAALVSFCGGYCSVLRDFIADAKKSKISIVVSKIVFDRLTEFGELFDNLPISKTPVRLHVMVPWIGLLLLLLTLFGLATKRRQIGPTEVFLVCYVVILFAWPFSDARFWLPVLPILIAYSLLAVRSLKFPNWVVMIYALVFATLGFVAIAYTTRISFAGSKFPDRYGDGELRPTYCAVFQSCQDGGDPNKVNAKALRLLREYK